MSRWTKAALVITLIGLCSWLYAAPYIAVRNMGYAIEARDAVRLADYVEFPALKESLKATFAATFVADADSASSSNPFAALGTALAVTMLNPMIDSLVTPEGLATLYRGEQPRPGSAGFLSPTLDPSVDRSMSYENINRFIVSVRKKANPKDPTVLVYNRYGLFSWKLSAVRLPK